MQEVATYRNPSVAYQSAFFFTGALAGASTLPAEYAYHRITTGTHPSPSTFLRSHLPAGLYRPAFRFWAFGVSRNLYQHFFPPPPGAHVRAALAGGLCGACGGIMEVLAQSLFLRKIPETSAVASQGMKLFLCFGSYTYLSNAFSDERPPKPFWKCWTMGAMAGAFGSAVMASVDGLRGRALLAATGKGAAVIGTVISVQVTSCKLVLDRVDEP